VLPEYTLGEDRSAPRTYYTGENPWGYQGICRVGTDDQWANGLTAEEFSSPGPYPLCCSTRTPTTWYLRAEKAGPQQPIPPGLLGTYDYPNSNQLGKLLSTEPGNSPVGALLTANLPAESSVPTVTIGAVQYTSKRFAADTLMVGNFVLGFGSVADGGYNETNSGYANCYLINGQTGTVRFTCFTNRFIGMARVNVGLQTTCYQVIPHAFTQAYAGDFLCLECGFYFNEAPLQFARTWNGVIIGSGATTITADQQPIAAPAAFLRVLTGVN